MTITDIDKVLETIRQNKLPVSPNPYLERKAMDNNSLNTEEIQVENIYHSQKRFTIWLWRFQQTIYRQNIDQGIRTI